MAATFATYTLTTGPVGAAPWLGEISAEGKRLPVVFRGKSEAEVLKAMSEFWAKEVEKVHESVARREQRIAAARAAREARAAVAKAQEGALA